MKHTKRSLVTSLISLLLCFAMLLGTTWAWFTDSATSAGNKIVSGNLKLDLEVLDEATKQWHSIKDSKEPLFDYDNWEPGYVDATVLKIENEGNLAFKWFAKFVSENDLSALADVIDVYVMPSDVEIGYPTDRDLDGYRRVGTVKQFVNSIEETTNGVLYPEDSEDGVSASYLGIVLKMQETAGNEYQGMSLGGSFDIQILATQYSYENDSFGNGYDADAEYPVLATQIKKLPDGADAIGFDLSYKNEIIATLNVPASAIADVTKPVSVTFSDMDPTETIVVGENTKAFAYDIEVSNLKENLSGDQLITVTLSMPNALPAAQVYHNGELISDAIYDEVAGTISFKTASFSPYAITWKERTASTIEELRECITGDDDVYIRLTGDIVIDSNEGTAGFNGSSDHMAVSSSYSYYNGVNISGKNVAIDLNGHSIVASGNVGAIFFVMPESSLNIVDTVGGGVVTAKTACYVVWAPYDEPSFCDIYSGIFVAHSYADMEEYTNRAIVYAGEGGTINVYGGYYLYDTESYTDKNGVTHENVNNGGFNVKDSTETQRITIYDGVMLINPNYRQDGYENNNNNWQADHDSIFLAEHCDLVKISKEVTIGDKTYSTWYQVQTSQPTKFETVFENTDKYIYRVGNMNTVALGSLFKTENAIAAGTTVNVTVTALNNAGVSYNYVANTSDWEKGTIKFVGTGLVDITIGEYTLTVEVVDAMNATTATSATKNNVVLLNDVTFSTVEVSGGYTLYGNGFKMTAPNDVRYYAMNVGFVTLNGGVLDNVQIVCPNFSHSVIYTANITESGNQHSYDSKSEVYGNVRSAVMADGNSKIVNSYIHGGRAAIFLRSGNLVVDNSTVSGGAAANIHAISAKSLTLRDVTMIQKPFQATVHDTSKTVMGLSGLFECDENGNSTPLILEGTLVQDAWINESYSQYIPSGLSSVIDVVLKKSDYIHDLDGTDSLNLGFTYIPQNTGGKISVDVTDNRTNKSAVPYASVEVSASIAKATIYSYKSTNGTSADFVGVEDFKPTTQGITAPTVSFTDTNENRVFETKFDEDYGWSSTLTVDLDAGDYTFSFDKLLAQKYGSNLEYTVETKEGATVDTAKAITLTASGVTTYVLTIKDEDATHTYYFTLTATKTSIPEPEVVDTTGGTPLLVVKSKGSDWSCAIPALEGIKIKYYTSANNSVTLDLATLTPSSTGKQNGTNNYWEYSNGYSLKVTCGYIHDTKQIYGMPVVVNNGGNKMYFTISSTNGYVSTSTASRTVTLTYEFTDPNGKTLTFSKTWQFNYADYKNGTQYSYSDFVNGTLKEASSCVTPNTLVTLADGTQKEIQYVTYEDKLLVWNFYTGEYDVAPASIVMNHGASTVNVTTLNFSDGTSINTINGHGFFDVATNEFVLIDEFNVVDYIGHSFVKQKGNGYSTTELVSYSVEEQYTEVWSLLTAEHYNCVLEGMWTVTAAEVDNSPEWLMPYVIGEDMKYDEVAMQEDIEKYGLYTYEDFADYMTYEQFVALGLENFKISVGKGSITWDEILYLISIHIG